MFLQYLKRVPLFSTMPERHLMLIQAQCREAQFQKGSVVIHQDEQSDDFYIILSGKVRVALSNEDGREVVLDTLKEGDFFGELSPFDNMPRSATIYAMDNVRALVLSREAFIRIIKGEPSVAVNLLSAVAKRLRKANETIETLAFLDVYGRTARMLMVLANEAGEKLSDGRLRLLCPTHQAIANRIGASREAVTKAMKTLAANGLITVKGKEVMITPKQFEIL